MERCDECGYDYGSLARSGISKALRALAGRHRAALGADPARLRAHGEPGVWSALEYACHVRDVLLVQRERVELARVEERPEFAPMRREERVVELGYNGQDPGRVGAELVAAAAALADTLDGFDEEGWTRTGVYNWPVRELRTVDWIGRHTVHEAHHHLQDVEGLLGAKG